MKKRVAALILGLFFILNALPCAALDINPATDRDFDVPCQAAILIDEDSGTVLYEKNADESRPIASITKIMTLLLTFEALDIVFGRALPGKNVFCFGDIVCDIRDVYCSRMVLPLIFFCVGGGALSEWADSIIILIER